MEGRDIGTVVFPDAELKVYLTAEPEVRAERRSQEITDLDYETVAADLARRDAYDQGREDSPLTEPTTPFVLDTTGMTVEEIVAELVDASMAEPAGKPTPARSRVRATTSSHQWGRPAGHIIAYRMVRASIMFAAKLLGRVQIIGAEKVPTDRPYVLAPVHRSNIDFALTSLVTRRRMRYMGKDSIWKVRLLGRFVTMLGAFPVRRGTADREAVRLCSEIIEGGEPIVMFPEGTRRTGPVVEDLFDGPAYVAAKGQVPIVPMGIGGSEAMMPKGAKLLHPSKLVLIVGDPIEPSAPTATGRVSRSGVTELTKRLGAEVQALFDEAQALAGRPNPPP